MPNTIELDPEIIYFTHSKIRKQFSGCGKFLQETLDEIIQGTTTIDQIPLIRVIYHEKYYSMNNRRLWLFKELKRLGRLDVITVELKRAESKSEIRLGTQMLSLQAKPCLK